MSYAQQSGKRITDPQDFRVRIFYTMYKELGELVSKPPLKTTNGKTYAIDDKLLQAKLYLINTHIEGFEQAAFGNARDEYNVRDILAWSYNQDEPDKFPFWCYTKMKFWQKMLTELYGPDKEEPAPTLPGDWQKIVTSITLQAMDNNDVDLSVEEGGEIINWYKLHQLFRDFFKQLGITEQPDLRLPVLPPAWTVKDAPQA